MRRTRRFRAGCLRLALLACVCAWCRTPRPACAQTAGPELTLVVDLEPGSNIDPAALKDAIAREIGVSVGFERDGKGGTIVVRQEGDRVVVSFDGPDGRHEGRAIARSKDPAQAVRDIALLAGNVARDQAAPFIVRQEPAPEPIAAPAKVQAPAPELRRGPCDRPEPRSAIGVDFLPFVGSSSWEPGRSSIRHISIGLVGALSGGVKGWAASSVANVDGSSLCGAELSGVANVVAGPVEGTQMAGVANVAADVGGAQLAGVINVASADVRGVQLATVNIAAGRVRGVQIGVVNYADDATLQLGVINVDASGRFHVDLWGKPEAGLLLAGIKHGGAHFHYIYGFGIRPEDTAHGWAVFGGGLHLAPSQRLFVDVELVAQSQLVFTSAQRDELEELRAVVGYSLMPHFALFAGPSFNVAVAQSQNGGPVAAPTGVPSYAWDFADGRSTAVRAWPGIVLGVEAL